MQTLTKQAIKKLSAEENHALGVEDFDDIEELDRFAQGVSGVTKHERRLLNSPFELCGIKFYPLTVAKTLWFREKVEEWGVSEPEQEGLLFWLLTLPLDDTALDTYSLEKDAQRACKRLSKRLHCTQPELIEVYRKCIGAHEDNETGESNEVQYGGMIACLIKEYGGSPEKWLYETPVDMIGALFDEFTKRVQAEEQATKTRQASGGKAKAPNVTVKLRSLGKFNAKLNEIREKWRQVDGD